MNSKTTYSLHDYAPLSPHTHAHKHSYAISVCHFDVIATKYNPTTTTVDDNNHNEEANNDNSAHHNNNNDDNDNATPNSVQLRR